MKLALSALMKMTLLFWDSVVPPAYAHEGSATFTVLSMAPGSWICNAQVTPGSSTAIKNSVSAVIQGPWSNNLTAVSDTGDFLNINQSALGHLRNSLHAVTFALKSPVYDATYTVDLCTSDPGATPGKITGPEIGNFKTWVSVTNLTSGDTEGVESEEGYLERAHVVYSSTVSCGAALTYSPMTLFFSDTSPVFSVPPTSIATEIPVIQDGSWNGSMTPTGKTSPYCVTRFVFTETSNENRNKILEGGLFNIAVTQNQ